MRKLAALERFYAVLSLSCYVMAILYYRHAQFAFGIPDNYFVFFVPMVGASAVAVAAEVWAASRKGYFIALAVHFILSAAVLPLVASATAVELFLFSILIVGVCLHNPFPLNILMALPANGVILLIRGFVLVNHEVPLDVIMALELEYGAFALLIALFTALMVFYREKLIDYQKDNERLDALVERLTRANLGYQEYAKSVEEASTDSERKRITRDIHDIVGYTLTNNITMMEAITDMMRVNPLGVATLVSSARENAEEGLARIREALHLLRSREIEYPTGLQAVEKLIEVFKRATGVSVEYVFTDVKWDFTDAVDFTLYHIIQESLMNSFRHGKATNVWISLTKGKDEIILRIRDNGLGASQFNEDIGLSGMRERVDQLGGTLHARPAVGGFEVSATISLNQKESDGE